MAWKTIRNPISKKIICRIDLERMILEHQEGRVTSIVDLAGKVPKAPKPASDKDEQKPAA